jgi:hypothetical protein
MGPFHGVPAIGSEKQNFQVILHDCQTCLDLLHDMG